MDEFRVVDNWLTERELTALSIIQSNQFPWNLQRSMDYYGDGREKFDHWFYWNHKPTSDYYEHVAPVVMKANPVAILQVKANLTLKEKESNKYGAFHCDYGGENLRAADKIISAVYYLDDLGGTEFKNGEFVKAKRNRIVFFNQKIEHRAVLHTYGPLERIILNLNFI